MDEEKDDIDAVQILQSVQIGKSGARITALEVSSFSKDKEDMKDVIEETKENVKKEKTNEPENSKRRLPNHVIHLNEEEVDKARKLVQQAKKRQRKIKKNKDN